MVTAPGSRAVSAGLVASELAEAGGEPPDRFDVVAVEMGADLSLKNVRHLKEAFWASAEGI